MGPAKRRGGSSGGGIDGANAVSSSGRSSKSSSGSRSKDRHSKNSDRYDMEEPSSRSKRDRNDEGGRSSSSRGGARSRILARASAAAASSKSNDRDGATNNSSPLPPPSHPRRRKALDPTLLARGMSARSLGARITSHNITTVSNDDMERDLRHMEAYGAACVAYAQQFFAYTNRTRVSEGHYGPIPPNSHPAITGGVNLGQDGAAYGMGGPGMDGYSENDQMYYYSTTGAVPISPRSAAESGQYPRGIHPQNVPSSTSAAGGAYPPNQQPPHHLQQISSAQLPQPPHPFSMPVRIDPEEEKRIALLRRRIAASEAKREVLETEYESLTNHVTHEFKRLRNSRRCMEGQVKLLQDLTSKRSDVLALRRVRVAAVTDVLACLQYRAMLLEEGVDIASGVTAAGGDAMEVDKTTTNAEGSSSPEKVGVVAEEPEDLLQAWDWIEAQLREAELATMSVEAPSELLDIKSDMEQKEKMSPDDVKSSSSLNKSNGKRSKSGTGGSGSSGKKESSSEKGDNEEMTKDGVGGKKADNEENGPPPTKKRRSRDDNEDDSNKQSKRNNNQNVTEDGSSNNASKDDSMNDEETRTTSSKKEEKKRSSSGSSTTTTGEDAVIPWEGRTIPRTPYNVPIYLSHLSEAPDRTGAFGCNDFMGAPHQSLSFIESILPSSVKPLMSNEKKELDKIRKEALFLSEELSKERERNNVLQKQIIKGRKKNDEMCCMMSMLRTETEAVLNRHNIILEMPEARARAGELAAAAEEDDEIEVEDVDDDGGSVLDYDGEEGEIIEEDETGGRAAAGGMSQDDDGEVHEDDDVDDGEDQGSLGMEDNTVGDGDGRRGAGASDSAEEGEIQEDDDVVNDGDDEEDMDDDDEEEGEILEEDAQPLKEVIVRMNSGGGNGGAQGTSSVVAAKGSGGVGDDEDDDEEEEGEIREDDWVGNRDGSDGGQGGSQGGEDV
mmetsp:Transcript_37489/g.54879  ORF Transcript_37489/g.54879 Transcript_37489/m.54879 type:complete len:950 (-) Transcript_37489:479-3328(-)